MKIAKNVFIRLFILLCVPAGFFAGLDTNKISAFFNSSLFEKEQNAYLIFDTDHNPLFREFVLDMFQEFLHKKKYYEKILNGQLMILFTKLLQLYENKIQYPPKIGKRGLTGNRQPPLYTWIICFSTAVHP